MMMKTYATFNKPYSTGIRLDETFIAAGSRCEIRYIYNRKRERKATVHIAGVFYEVPFDILDVEEKDLWRMYYVGKFQPVDELWCKIVCVDGMNDMMMALDLSVHDKDENCKVCKLLNGEDIPFAADGAFKYDEDDGVIMKMRDDKYVPYIRIRGWGTLIGVGGYHLDSDYAARVQDSFRDYVIDRLNIGYEMHKNSQDVKTKNA